MLDGRGVLWLAALAAFLFCMGLAAFLPLDRLDRMFLPDDTYYTLTISRSIAAGLGPSVDGGVNLTSGFQPLIALFQVPAFWLSSDPYVPVRATILASAFFWWLSAIFAARLGTVVAGIFVILLPMTLSNGLNGLETSLTAALCLATILVTQKIGARPINVYFAGALMGLSLLARIDSCFLVAALGIWIWVRFGFVTALKTALSASVVVAPWWGWCWVTFGSPVPESGAAVREIITHYHQILGPGRGWGVVRLWQAFGVGWHTWAWPSMTSAFTLIFGLVWLLVRGLRGNGLGVALFVASVVSLAFYTLYLPAFWFFDRYFNLVVIFALIGVSWLFQDFWKQGARLQKIGTLLMGGSLVIPIVMMFWVLSILLTPDALNLLTWLYTGPKGYAAPIQEVLKTLPSDAHIGAMQSGALGYFAPASMQVHNLDGVVNSAAQVALKEKDMAGYFARYGITWFVDWDMNVLMLEGYWGQGDLGANMSLVGKVPAPSAGLFDLLIYRVDLAGLTP